MEKHTTPCLKLLPDDARTVIVKLKREIHFKAYRKVQFILIIVIFFRGNRNQKANAQNSSMLINL